MNKKAYLLISIEEYGKFIAYCIENDISVFRTYWNEREKAIDVIALIGNRKDAIIAQESTGKVRVTKL